MQGVANNKTNKGKNKADAASSTWLVNSSIIAFGGMISTCLMVWAMQTCAVAWHGGYNIDPDAHMWLIMPIIMTAVWLVITINGGFEPPNSDEPSYTFRGDDSSTTTNLFLFGSLIVFCLGFINVPINFGILLICGSSIGFLHYLPLSLIYPDRDARRFAALTWTFGFFALWVMAGVMSSISIWTFLLVWIILGALGGNAVTIANKKADRRQYQTAGHTWRSSEATKEQVQRSRRARMTSAVVSQYGRIPQDTFDIFNQHVRRVTGPVASALPVLSDNEVRNFTVREILTVTLRDWRENDNLAGLLNVDVDDLRSFVDASVEVAGNLDDVQSIAVYKSCLRALLLDWLANWNVDEKSGPPIRR